MRRSLRVRRLVRDRFREWADERDLSYTEAVLMLIPEDPEPLVYGETAWMDVQQPAYERLDAARGEGASYTDVIAYHLLRQRKENT